MLLGGSDMNQDIYELKCSSIMDCQWILKQHSMMQDRQAFAAVPVSMRCPCQ